MVGFNQVRFLPSPQRIFPVASTAKKKTMPPAGFELMPSIVTMHALFH
jgi:hypothetical protein